MTTGLVYLCRTIYDILLWLQALDVGGAMLTFSLFEVSFLSVHSLYISMYTWISIWSGLWAIAMFCATRGMTHPPTSRNCEGNPQNSLTLLHFHHYTENSKRGFPLKLSKRVRESRKGKVIFPFVFATLRKNFHKFSPSLHQLVTQIGDSHRTRVHGFSRHPPAPRNATFRDRT